MSKLDICLDDHSVSSGDKFPPNASKWLLWQDPIFSFLDDQYKDHNLEEHFDSVRFTFYLIIDVSCLEASIHQKFGSIPPQFEAQISMLFSSGIER